MSLVTIGALQSQKWQSQNYNGGSWYSQELINPQRIMRLSIAQCPRKRSVVQHACIAPHHHLVLSQLTFLNMEYNQILYRRLCSIWCNSMERTCFMRGKAVCLPYCRLLVCIWSADAKVLAEALQAFEQKWSAPPSVRSRPSPQACFVQQIIGSN